MYPLLGRQRRRAGHAYQWTLLFDVSLLLVFSVHVAGYCQVANEFDRKIIFFLGLVEVGGGGGGMVVCSHRCARSV